VSLDIGDAAGLLDSFLLHLRAERKSPQTVKTYGDGIRLFLRWCEAESANGVGQFELDRPTVDKWIASLLGHGAEAATARSRQLAVPRFSAWLADEGEIPADELARMSPPKLDAKAVDPLSDEQLVSMLAACRARICGTSGTRRSSA
jgi:integrase/recombinase XerC